MADSNTSKPLVTVTNRLSVPALEALGNWVPLLVIIPFMFEPSFTSVFLAAYGSGSLLAAGALLALAFLARGSGSRIVALVLGLIVVAFVWQGKMLGGSALSDTQRAAQTSLFSSETHEVWLTVITFFLIAIIRTVFVLKEATGFDENQ